MKHPTDMGMNRTGIAMAPRLRDDMVKGAESVIPGSTAVDMAGVRTDYSREAPAIGSTPPPASAGGVLKSGMQMIQGKKPSVLLDKLGERLAFERTGTRLYEALLAKFDSEGSWQGGPVRDQLQRFHDEERAHFELVRDAIESLGADPTAMTPSADVAGITAEGVLKVMTDPRSSLPACLQALLIAELADHDGWEMLIRLADTLGHNDLAAVFRGALHEEDQHLAMVRNWLNTEIEHEARGELH